MEQNRRPRRSSLQRNRTQQGTWLSYMLAAVILLFTLLNLFVPDRQFSEAENRNLSTGVELSWQSLKDGSYFEGIDDALADQFVGRDAWISLRLAYTQFMGQKESNGVLLCDDDYLMEKPVAPNEEAVSKNMQAISAFAARHSGVKTNVCIAPTAACVMSEKLPSNAPIRNQEADIAALEEMLTGANFIDVTQALKAESKRALYYRTDHHWTSLGAYYAFMDMADDLALLPVEEYDIYTVSTTFEGTLASKSGSHSATDTVEVYAPKTTVDYRVTYTDSGTVSGSMYHRQALESKDHYTVFFGGNFPRIDIETTAASGRSLLLFKDSYANCMVQFLTPYYDKIVMIDPRYYMESGIDTLVTAEKITDVLFLYNVNTFHEDTSLHNALR